MGVSEIIAEVIAIVTASVLLMAAITKLRPDPQAAATIKALGFGGRLLPSTRIAHMVGFAEVLAFVGITLVRTWMSLVAVGLLGVAFATAGGFAWRRGLSVQCGCFDLGLKRGRFGSGNGSRLGARQVLLLPAWLVAASLPLAVPSYAAQQYSVRFLSAYAAIGIGTVVVLWSLIPLWTRLVDRRLRAGGF